MRRDGMSSGGDLWGVRTDEKKMKEASAAKKLKEEGGCKVKKRLTLRHIVARKDEQQMNK